MKNTKNPFGFIKEWFLYQIPLIIGGYELERWLLAVKGKELEKEGGKRCEVCFSFRLKESARKAKEKGISHFATTLAISPHKDADLIKKLGEEIGRELKVYFLFEDFRSSFKEGIEEAKRLSLYRQRYCGCLYSLQG